MKIHHSIYVECIAPKTGHHHKRIVRIGGFAKMADRPELVEAKSFWDDLFARNRREGPALDCPVSLTIDLTWPWNTSDTKKDRMKGLVWHSAKPDLENTAKTIIDAMVRQGYFVNDSRVVSLTLRKYRGDAPSVAITIEKELP